MNKPLVTLAAFFAFGLVGDSSQVVYASLGLTRNTCQESTNASTENSQNEGPLVTPEWLAKNLTNPKIRVLGMGQKIEQYEAAHIPQEQYIDWKTEMTDPANPGRFNLPPKDNLEKLLGRLGVSNDSIVVLTDNLSSRLSTRMYWTLKCYGHQNIKILDGGRKAWVKSGRDFTKEIPKLKPTKYVANEMSAKHYADIDAVRRHLTNDNSILVDGRPPKQFKGEDAGKAFHTGDEHKRKGHIVSAKNIVWADNFTSDGKFKSREELLKMYLAAGVKDSNDVITYCNEGLHAAPPWFVLTELLGYPEVKVYDDSMAEWANRDDTPMEISKEKTKK